MNKIAIYNKILVKIKQYDTIIIHRHIRPTAIASAPKWA